MKITVLRKNLKDGLIAVERGVTDNNNLPVLKHILIKTVNNKVQLSSTNLELAVVTFVSGKIIEDGGIAVPFSTFNSIISNTDSERIDIEVKSNNLLIKTDNYEAKIQGLPESDFPIIPKITSNQNFLEIDPAILKESLNQVSVAVSYSEIRPELNGVLLDYQVNILKFAATDSFRLAEKTLYENQVKTALRESLKVIVPIKTIQEVVRVFNNSPVLILVGDNQILFKNDNVEIISRLIDGTYPDYEQIIPKSTETELSLNRSDLMKAIKLVSSFSGKVNDIHLKLTSEKKVLEVYSSNQYLGENNYLVPVKQKGADFSDIVFNWKYLLDGLKALNSENLVFILNGDMRPAMFKTSEDKSYFYIVMPIKI